MSADNGRRLARRTPNWPGVANYALTLAFFAFVLWLLIG